MKRHCPEPRCLPAVSVSEPDELRAHLCRERSKYTDMTVTCAGETFCLHRVVASLSGYFGALLSHTDEALHRSIELHEIGSGPTGPNGPNGPNGPSNVKIMLRATIDWLYTGDIAATGTPTTAQTLTLLEASRFFQVEGMERQCVERLERCIKPDEAVMAWEHADRIACDVVCTAALRVMGPVLSRLAPTPAFRELPLSSVNRLLRSESLRLNCEQDAYHAAMGWMWHSECTEAIGVLLEAVNMRRLPVEFMLDTVSADVLLAGHNAAHQIFASTLRDRHGRGRCVFRRREYGLSDALVFVGGDFDEPTAFIYDPETRRRSDLSAPRARRGCAAVVIEGKLCVFGGDTPSGLANCGDTFDPAARVWRQRKGLPTARRDFASVVNGGVLYVMGGMDDESERVRDASAYDIATNQWRQLPPMKHPGGCAAVCVGDRVLVFGASGANGTVTGARAEAYDITTGVWSDLPPSDVERTGVAAVLLDGLVYVLGGLGFHEDGEGAVLDVAEVYDPVANTWTRIADMGLEREEPCAVAHNGFVYAMGGCEYGGNDLAYAEKYCPIKRQWERLPDMPEAIACAGLVSL